MPVHQHIALDDRRRRASLEGGNVRFGEFEHGVVWHVFGPFGRSVVGMRGIVRSDCKGLASKRTEGMKLTMVRFSVAGTR